MAAGLGNPSPCFLMPATLIIRAHEKPCRDAPAWLAGLIQSSVDPLTHPRIVSVATDRVAAAEEWYCECARVQLGGRLR